MIHSKNQKPCLTTILLVLFGILSPFLYLDIMENSADFLTFFALGLSFILIVLSIFAYRKNITIGLINNIVAICTILFVLKVNFIVTLEIGLLELILSSFFPERKDFRLYGFVFLVIGFFLTVLSLEGLH